MKDLLEEIRVLDLSRLLPGAYCTQLLADLGAQVLKVEEPGSGDYLRYLNPWLFGAMNRNKMSLTLNIKDPRGQKIFVQLIETQDVLLETFRPGVMERLGFGYQTVSRVNPRIVYCSMSGYGQDGPYRLQSGHDLNYLGVAGVLSLTNARGGVPTAPPLPIADLAGSLFASHAILAALLARTFSGVGCYVDAAMTDAVLSLMSVRLAPALGRGKTTRQDLIRGGAYEVYRSRDDRFITLGVIEDKFWRNLARAIGREDLVRDPRFATDRSRTEHRQAVRETLAPILAEKSLEEWMAVFEGKDVPAAPVNRLEEIEADPQVQHRGLLFDLPDETGRSCKQVGYPVHFADQKERHDQPPPAMGRDTRVILAGLGYTGPQIRSLAQQGVIALAGEAPQER